MSSKPEPPADSKEVSEYKAGDEVYYYRAGRWRDGTIKSKGGSSDESPRYLVMDSAKQDERLIEEGDIRKKT